MLRPILLFDIESNMHNKHLGRFAMSKSEYLEGLPPYQCGIRKYKAAEIKALNNHLLYDLIRHKTVYDTSKFSELICNNEIFLHRIYSLSPQRVDVPKELIICACTTLQKQDTFG